MGGKALSAVATHHDAFSIDINVLFKYLWDMHRTTLALESPVERELRRLAMTERRSFKDLVNDLLRRALKSYKKEKVKETEFEWITSDAKPIPGFDPSDRSTYMDFISRKIP